MQHLLCITASKSSHTRSTLSAHHKPPQKASRDWEGECTKSACSHQQTISPEIDNNVMLVNSQVVCFLAQKWPEQLTSLRLSCFFMFHMHYAPHSFKNRWIFPIREGKKGRLYKVLLTTLLPQAARHTQKKKPYQTEKKPQPFNKVSCNPSKQRSSPRGCIATAKYIDTQSKLVLQIFYNLMEIETLILCDSDCSLGLSERQRTCWKVGFSSA